MQKPTNSLVSLNAARKRLTLSKFLKGLAYILGCFSILLLILSGVFAFIICAIYALFAYGMAQRVQTPDRKASYDTIHSHGDLAAARELLKEREDIQTSLPDHDDSVSELEKKSKWAAAAILTVSAEATEHFYQQWKHPKGEPLDIGYKTRIFTEFVMFYLHWVHRFVSLELTSNKESKFLDYLLDQIDNDLNKLKKSCPLFVGLNPQITGIYWNERVNQYGKYPLLPEKTVASRTGNNILWEFGEKISNILGDPVEMLSGNILAQIIVAGFLEPFLKLLNTSVPQE